MRRAACLTGALGMLLCCLTAPPATALPTMIRLSYPNCTSCHIAPQGSGLLNAYGRGIDEAQSLRNADYKETDTSRNWFARSITQDFRSINLESGSYATGQPLTGVLRSRLQYRNDTELGAGFRLAVIGAIEDETDPRPALVYEPAIIPHTLYQSHDFKLYPYLVNALLSFRFNKNKEISFGRDQLPTGVNIPVLDTLIRTRNRLGYYDNPTQLKFFWWCKRYQLVPYAFAPGGNEPKISGRNSGEYGGGSLAEFDLLGKERTIVGMNILDARSQIERRRLVGPYARLGFGSWGILAEHDITDRTYLPVAPAPHFRQQASFVQLFWATREWLVLSLIGEQLRVGNPFKEQDVAVTGEAAVRLSSEFTVTVGSTYQRNLITGMVNPSGFIQLAMKPVFKR
jgi:hypothetical protein